MAQQTNTISITIIPVTCLYKPLYLIRVIPKQGQQDTQWWMEKKAQRTCFVSVTCRTQTHSCESPQAHDAMSVNIYSRETEGVWRLFMDRGMMN